jgi:hypothetical protein
MRHGLGLEAWRAQIVQFGDHAPCDRAKGLSCIRHTAPEAVCSHRCELGIFAVGGMRGPRLDHGRGVPLWSGRLRVVRTATLPA